MQQYIAFLRGINVSGQKRVPMAELRSLLTDAGLHDVSTYIQSGNVLFKGIDQSNDEIENLMTTSIQSHYNFEVPVSILRVDTLEAILRENPFPQNVQDRCYYVLLFNTPAEESLSELMERSTKEEPINYFERCVYLCPLKGYGKAKLNNNYIERILKMTATTRNHRTMLKLLSLSAEN